jgi:methionyl-tRNA synthetase
MMKTLAVLVLGALSMSASANYDFTVFARTTHSTSCEINKKVATEHCKYLCDRKDGYLQSSEVLYCNVSPKATTLAMRGYCLYQ